MKQQQSETAFPADPIIVFLAGVFTGIVAGPQLLVVGRDMIKARGSEFAAIAIDRFVSSLKTEMGSHERNLT